MGNFVNELNNYQPIPRDLVFDSTLSDRARFVYVYMASKPNDWSFFIEPMAKDIGYSSETLRKYINELIASGWLIKGAQQKENGMFGAVQYTLKASKNTVSEKVRVGEIPSQTEKRECEQKRDSKEEIKEYKEKFSAFVALYKKLTGKQVRGVDTEFNDFTKRHRDWKKVIPILPIAIQRETRARNDAKAMHKFFPEPKMLQTYLGKQRAWEMFVNTNEDLSDIENQYTPATDGAILWSEKRNCYIYLDMFFGFIPDGYKDDERPDGATIMLNNSCKLIKWNKNNKSWDEI